FGGPGGAGNEAEGDGGNINAESPGKDGIPLPEKKTGQAFAEQNKGKNGQGARANHPANQAFPKRRTLAVIGQFKVEFSKALGEPKLQQISAQATHPAKQKNEPEHMGRKEHVGKANAQKNRNALEERKPDIRS